MRSMRMDSTAGKNNLRPSCSQPGHRFTALSGSRVHLPAISAGSDRSQQQSSRSRVTLQAISSCKTSADQQVCYAPAQIKLPHESGLMREPPPDSCLHRKGPFGYKVLFIDHRGLHWSVPNRHILSVQLFALIPQ